MPVRESKKQLGVHGSVPPRSPDEARQFVDRPGASGASWSTAQRAFEAGGAGELGYR